MKSSISPFVQGIIFAASGILGFIFQRSIASGGIPKLFDALHYIFVFLFVIFAAISGYQKLRGINYTTATYVGLHISFGWIFGVAWAVRSLVK